MRQEGGNLGMGVHPTMGLGKRRKLPHGVCQKLIYAYFNSEISHLEHPFQYFWVMTGPPKRRGAWENFPPFTSLSTDLI